MSERPNFPQPKARELSDAEAQQLAHRAFDLEHRVKGAIARVREDTWALAESLHEFHQLGARGYQLLGYGSLGEFLGQPDLGISRAWYFRLIQTWRDLVEVKRVSPARLSGIDATKVEEVRPAIMRGDVAPEDALSDAEVLSRSDLREKYSSGRDPSAPLAAEGEPVRVIEGAAREIPRGGKRCPTCGGSGWLTNEQLPLATPAQEDELARAQAKFEDRAA